MIADEGAFRTSEEEFQFHRRFIKYLHPSNSPLILPFLIAVNQHSAAVYKYRYSAIIEDFTLRV